MNKEVIGYLRLEVRGERLKPEKRKEQGPGIDIVENGDIRKRLGDLESRRLRYLFLMV